MIQRIQTLWLFLAAGVLLLCFAFPVATFHYEGLPTPGQETLARLDLIPRACDDMMTQMGEPVVRYAQKMTGMPTWPLVTGVVLCALLALVSLFLFKNRVVQVRLVAFGFLLNVAYVFLLFFWAVDKYADLLSQGMGGAKPDVSWAAGAFLPIFSLLLFFLAQRAIKKDEARVRAADRLR